MNRVTLLERELPRTPSAGRLARRELSRRLAERGLQECVQDASTVVAELVNNAYLHGVGRILLRVEERPGRLRIEVQDDGSGEAGRGALADRYGPGGFGLHLVRALALDCGRQPGSARTWAELRCPSRRAAPAARARRSPGAPGGQTAPRRHGRR